jgi:hypothetical protein
MTLPVTLWAATQGGRRGVRQERPCAAGRDRRKRRRAGGDAECRWRDPHARGSAGRTARGQNHGGGVALTRFLGVETHFIQIPWSA